MKKNQPNPSGAKKAAELAPGLDQFLAHKYRNLLRISEKPFDPIVWAYLRYSCEKTNESPDEIAKTIESQKSSIVRFVKDRLKNSIPDERFLIDAAKSGGSTDRDAFQKLVKLVTSVPLRSKPPDLDIIVLYDHSRLMRNLAEFTAFLFQCQGRGIEVWESSTGQELTDEKSAVYAIGMGLFAELRRAQDSKTSRDHSLERARNGYATGNVPYGYKLAEESSGRKIPIIDEEKATVVKFIFKKYAAGWSLRTISHYLTNVQIPSPGSKNGEILPWHKHTISYVLNNEYYLGDFYYGKRRYKYSGIPRPSTSNPNKGRYKGTPIPAQYSDWVHLKVPDIINITLWNKAHARLKIHNRHQTCSHNDGRREKKPSIVSRMFRCSLCGGILYQRGLKTRKNFQCSLCGKTLIRYDQAITIIQGLLDRFVQKHLPDLFHIMTKVKQQKLRDLSETSYATREVTRLTKLRAKLEIIIASDNFPVFSPTHKRYTQVLNELKIAEDKISALKSQKMMWEKGLSFSEDKIKEALLNGDSINTNDQQKIEELRFNLQNLLGQIVIKNERDNNGNLTCVGYIENSQENILRFFDLPIFEETGQIPLGICPVSPRVKNTIKYMHFTATEPKNGSLNIQFL